MWADVLDILQKVSRDGEVVGQNRTGHVAVLGLMSVGEGEGPCDLSQPLFDLLASGKRCSHATLIWPSN